MEKVERILRNTVEFIYITHLRTPKIRVIWTILDVQSDPNFEAGMLETGGYGCANDRRCSGTVNFRQPPIQPMHVACGDMAGPKLNDVGISRLPFVDFAYGFRCSKASAPFNFMFGLTRL
jgi:hypothetical protein